MKNVILSCATEKKDLPLRAYGKFFSSQNFILDNKNKVKKFSQERTSILNLQSVHQETGEPRMDDATRCGAIDYGGPVILHPDNLSSRELNVDCRGTCWITGIGSVEIIVGVTFFINQKPEARPEVVASLHNREPS